VGKATDRHLRRPHPRWPAPRPAAPRSRTRCACRSRAFIALHLLWPPPAGVCDAATDRAVASGVGAHAASRACKALRSVAPRDGQSARRRAPVCCRRPTIPIRLRYDCGKARSDPCPASTMQPRPSGCDMRHYCWRIRNSTAENGTRVPRIDTDQVDLTERLRPS